MKSFSELQLNPLLSRAIEEMGFETPTEIQAQALPLLLGEPTDFLGLAATGTGKTVAFGIPLLERLEPSRRALQGLILCPTRELALQVSGQIDLLGKHLGIRALPIYGGAPYPEQIRGLKQGARIVVGTPGRIVDHLERGTLDLSEVSTVILDEADEMISMGFKEDLETILANTPPDTTRTWMFSATMSREVRAFADGYLREPEFVQVNRTEVVPERIDQIYYRAHESDKPEIICKLIDAADGFYGIIFCQTKSLVADLTQYLKERAYPVDCLHGDLDQNARERAMKGFRERRSSVLVCTDVASRGLDVKDITHVINYSLPRELDNYVHRIGRTARSGKTGFAMSLVTPSHRGLIPRIERATQSKMREGRLPTRKEIGIKKVSGVLSRFQGQAGFVRAQELLSDEWKSAVAEMDREEIVARFLALSFPEIFEERSKGEAGQANPEARVLKAEIREPREERTSREKPYREERRPERHQERSSQDRPYQNRAQDRRFERDTEPRARRYGERRDAGYDRRPESGSGNRSDGGYGQHRDGGYEKRPRSKEHSYGKVSGPWEPLRRKRPRDERSDRY